MNLQKLWRYLTHQNKIPLLPRAYIVERDRTPTYAEGLIIAKRLARTPDQAAALLKQHGGDLDRVLARRPPTRKAPPVRQRIGRIVRQLFKKDRTPTYAESLIMSKRLARTPDQAAALLKRHGDLDKVLKLCPPSRARTRKAAPPRRNRRRRQF